MLKQLLAFGLSALMFSACAEVDDLVDSDAEVDQQTRDEAVGTSSNALGQTCYCAGAAACGHSASPSYMFSGAHSAMLRAGVTDGSLTQTYGDAPASVGTHCPEPGKAYSAATDIQQSANPCGRTRKLRAQGFAAWFRTAPEFPGNLHIHAVYAGAPGLKASLQRQVASFLDGRDGLAGNKVDAHCPITQAEKDTVRAVQSGGTAPAPATGTAIEACVAGGSYCGGDKVKGDANTLYRCNTDGTATLLQACTNGCSVNAGRDDSCK